MWFRKKRSKPIAQALTFGSLTAISPVSHAAQAQQIAPAPAREHFFRDAIERQTFCDMLDALIDASVQSQRGKGAKRICAKDRKRMQRFSDAVRFNEFFEGQI